MSTSDKPKDGQDWSNFIPIMTNVQDRTGISLEWQKVWSEVENWYGDIKKKETGQQFLLRMQATYFQTPPTSSHQGKDENVWNHVIYQLGQLYRNQGLANWASKAHSTVHLWRQSLQSQPAPPTPVITNDPIAFAKWKDENVVENKCGGWLVFMSEDCEEFMKVDSYEDLYKIFTENNTKS